MKVIPQGGQEVVLGATEAAPTIGIIDYSRRVTDEFGVTTVVERGFARRMSVRLALPFSNVDGVQRQLAAIRATPAQWIAGDGLDWLSINGFYKDFQIDLAVPPTSFCTLTVEGLAESEPSPDTSGNPAPNGMDSTLSVLRPLTITEAMLTATNVPETDYPQWSAGTTYALGARVINTATHRKYESAASGNVGHNPGGNSGKWIDIGPTNRWAMFDQAIGTATTRATSVQVTLSVTSVNAVALLDVVGSTVRVQATGYDRTINVGPGTVTFLDMPATTGSVIVTVTGSQASIGTLLIGSLLSLGITEASPSAGINDFSRKETDEFGGVTIVERAWAKRMGARSLIRTEAVDDVANRVASVRARPSLWIGNEGTDSLTVYGFFKEFSIEVGESVSTLTLSIEGITAANILDGLPLGSVEWPSVRDPDGTKPANNADVTSENQAASVKDQGPGATAPANAVLNQHSALPPGIAIGAIGNVQLSRNMLAGGTANDGEIRVNGTTLYIPGRGKVTIADLTVETPFEGVTAIADKFYLVLGVANKTVRFAGYVTTTPTNPFFPAVYNWSTGQWAAIDNSATLYPFTPLETDCLLAVCSRPNTATVGIGSLLSLIDYWPTLPADGATVGAVHGVNFRKPDNSLFSDDDYFNSSLDLDVDVLGPGGRGRVSFKRGPGWINRELPARVQNLDLSIDSSGLFQGIGSGNSQAVRNSNLSISSSGALAGGGGGQVTLPGIGFTGDTDAQRNDRISINPLNGRIGGIHPDSVNYRVWNDIISVSGATGAIDGIGDGSGTIVNNGFVNLDADGDLIAGYGKLGKAKNGIISISASGALAGAGPGQVTLPGLGFSGDTDAQRNSRISVAGDGGLDGVGGTRAVVSNVLVDLDAAGDLVAGYGAKGKAKNGVISISAAGALAGAGGGQVTFTGIAPNESLKLARIEQFATNSDNLILNSQFNEPFAYNLTGGAWIRSGGSIVAGGAGDPGKYFRSSTSAGLVPNADFAAGTARIPSSPSEKLYFSALVRRMGSGSVGNGVWARAYCYNAAGTYLGISNQPTGSPTTHDTWQLISLLITTLPATASFELEILSNQEAPGFNTDIALPRLARTQINADVTAQQPVVSQLSATSGRAKDGRLMNGNYNFGFESLVQYPTMTVNDNGSYPYTSIGSDGILYPDWQGSIALPSATIAPQTYGYTYYYWRNQADPTTAGESYGHSIYLTDANATGKIYLGKRTMPSGAGSPPPPPPPDPGNPDCVVEGAYVATADGHRLSEDICLTDTLVILDYETLDGTKFGAVECNEAGTNRVVRITTEGGISLTVSHNTPLVLPCGRYIEASGARNFELPVLDHGKFGWQRCVNVEWLGERRVRVLKAFQSTYAAGDEHDRYILTHNPFPTK